MLVEHLETRRITGRSTELLWPSDTTGSAVAIREILEVQPKFTISESGVVAWGPGGATATDTTLSRSSAGILAIAASSISRPLAGSRLITLLTESSAVSNTTDQTAFDKSHTIPANELGVAGTVVSVLAGGIASTTGTPVLSIAIKVGAIYVAYISWTCGNNISNRPWRVQGGFHVSSVGASGTAWTDAAIGVMTLASAPAGTSSGSTADTDSFTIDTTATQAITVTATWGAADPSNTTKLQTLNIGIQYPTATIA